MLQSHRFLATLLLGVGCLAAPLWAAPPQAHVARSEAAEPSLQEIYHVQLPVVGRTPSNQAENIIVISGDKITINDRVICVLRSGFVEARELRDGAQGKFITAVYEALIDKGSAAALLADQGTDYRLLSAVLYSAAQAGINKVAFMLCAADQPNCSQLWGLHIEVEASASKRFVAPASTTVPSLYIDRQGAYWNNQSLRLAATAEEGFKTQVFADKQQLLDVAALRLQATTFQQQHAAPLIYLDAEASTPYARLVQAAEAVLYDKQGERLFDHAVVWGGSVDLRWLPVFAQAHANCPIPQK